MAIELDSIDKLSAPQGSIDACLVEPGPLNDVRHRSTSSPEILYFEAPQRRAHQAFHSRAKRSSASMGLCKNQLDGPDIWRLHG